MQYDRSKNHLFPDQKFAFFTKLYIQSTKNTLVLIISAVTPFLRVLIHNFRGKTNWSFCTLQKNEKCTKIILSFCESSYLVLPKVSTKRISFSPSIRVLYLGQASQSKILCRFRRLKMAILKQPIPLADSAKLARF